jgi:hypothetical protein
MIAASGDRLSIWAVVGSCAAVCCTIDYFAYRAAVAGRYSQACELEASHDPYFDAPRSRGYVALKRLLDRLRSCARRNITSAFLYARPDEHVGSR